MEAKGSAKPVSLVAGEVRHMPGMSLVKVAARNGEPSPRLILAGEGTLAGLGRPKRASPGSLITISPPAWDIDLGPVTGSWAVACDWTVQDEVP